MSGPTKQTAGSLDDSGADPRERVTLFSDGFVGANGFWRNVCVAIGREAPDGDAIKEYRTMVEQIIRENPDGVGILTIIQPNSTPTPSGREALVSLYRDLWPHLRGAAYVVEARGFVAAAQRSVAAAFLMTTGLVHRIKLFTTIDDASQWLASMLVETRPDVPSAEKLSILLSQLVTDFYERHRSKE